MEMYAKDGICGCRRKMVDLCLSEPENQTVKKLFEIRKNDMERVTELFRILAKNETKICLEKEEFVPLAFRPETDEEPVVYRSGNKQLIESYEKLVLKMQLQSCKPYLRIASVIFARIYPFHWRQSTIMLPALRDSSADVRRAAVSCCHDLIHQDNFEDPAFMDLLYKMIYDPDPFVVGSLLSVLDEILKKKGGIVLDVKIVKHLICRIPSFPEWTVNNVFLVLREGILPENVEEVLELINFLCDKLATENVFVFVISANIVIKLINAHHSKLDNNVIQKISTKLILCFRKASGETQCAILDFIEKFASNRKDFCSEHHAQFFCRSNDSVDLKLKKLRFLEELINEGNCCDIFEEILTQFHDCSEVAKQAVVSFMCIFKSHFWLAHYYVNELLQLMCLNYNNLKDIIICQLSEVNLNQVGELKGIILGALFQKHVTFDSKAGKKAYIDILTNYGHCLHCPFDIFSHLMINAISEKDTVTEHALIAAIPKVFGEKFVWDERNFANVIE